MARPKKINELEPTVNSEVQDSLENIEPTVNSEVSTMKFVEINFETKNTIVTNPNDVTFIVEYSKEYKGKKTMPQGEVIISKESAEIFISRGMGKIKI